MLIAILLTVVAIVLLQLHTLRRIKIMSNESIFNLLAELKAGQDAINARLDVMNTQGTAGANPIDPSTIATKDDIAALSTKLDTVISDITAGTGTAGGTVDLSHLATSEALTAVSAQLTEVDAKLDTVLEDIGTVTEAVTAPAADPKDAA